MGTGFFLYLQKNKDALKAKAGGDYKKSISMGSAVWQEMSGASRKPYEDEATSLKEKYDEDMKVFLSNGGMKKRKILKKPTGDSQGAEGTGISPKKKRKI